MQALRGVFRIVAVGLLLSSAAPACDQHLHADGPLLVESAMMCEPENRHAHAATIRRSTARVGSADLAALLDAVAGEGLQLKHAAASQAGPVGGPVSAGGARAQPPPVQDLPQARCQIRLMPGHGRALHQRLQHRDAERVDGMPWS